MPNDSGPNVLLALQQIATIMSRALGEIAETLGKAADGSIVPLAVHREEDAPAIAEAAVVETTALAEPAPSLAPPPPIEKAPEFVPVQQAAEKLQKSTAFIYGLINRGMVAKHYPYGPALTMVCLEEVQRIVEKSSPGGRVRSLAPEGRVWAQDAARELEVANSTVYKLIQQGAFPGAAQDDSRRYSIPRIALDEYKRAIGRLPFLRPRSSTSAPPPVVEAPPTPKAEAIAVPVPAVPAPVPEEQPVTPPSVPEPPEELALGPQLKALEEEVTSLEPYLANMTPAYRTCHLATWAGTARKIAEYDGKLTGRAWTLIHRLEPIANKYGAWVNAVIPTWTFEDWDLYIRAHAINRPQLSAIEEQVLIEGELKGLLSRSKAVKKERVDETLSRAKSLLSENHRLLQFVTKHFARRFKEEQAEAEVQPERQPDVSAEVLAVTKGKRLLIIGGQRERDQYRQNYMEQLQLANCEWVTSERNKAHALLRAGERANLKNFDLMVYVAAFIGHAGMKVVQMAKRRKLPVVMLGSGYSVAQVAAAIAEQYTPVETVETVGTSGSKRTKAAPTRTKAKTAKNGISNGQNSRTRRAAHL